MAFQKRFQRTNAFGGVGNSSQRYGLSIVLVSELLLKIEIRFGQNFDKFWFLNFKNELKC